MNTVLFILLLSAPIQAQECEVSSGDQEIGAMQLKFSLENTASLSSTMNRSLEFLQFTDQDTIVSATGREVTGAAYKMYKLQRNRVVQQKMQVRRKRCSALTSCSAVNFKTNNGENAWTIPRSTCSPSLELWFSDLYSEDRVKETKLKVGMLEQSAGGKGWGSGYDFDHRPTKPDQKTQNDHILRSCCCPRIKLPCMFNSAPSCGGRVDARHRIVAGGEVLVNLDQNNNQCMPSRSSASPTCEPWAVPTHSNPSDEDDTVLGKQVGKSSCFDTGRQCEPLGYLRLQPDRFETDADLDVMQTNNLNDKPDLSRFEKKHGGQGGPGRLVKMSHRRKKHHRKGGNHA